MHYHGAYYSNYHTWLKESPLITPSSHLVWSLIGQESVNTLKCNTLGHEGIFTYLLCITPSCDSFYTGIQITTGLFHLWHSTDIYSTLHLQHTCMTSIITTITYTLSPTHPPNTHVILPPILTPTLHPLRSELHPLTILGSSSITQYAHQSHTPSPSSTHFTHPHQHLSQHLHTLSNRIEPLVNYTSTYTITYTLTLTTLHHLSLGLISLTPTSPSHLHLKVYNTIHLDFLQHTSTSWHTQLSTYLTTLGSSSIASTHHLLLSSHPHLSSTYPTHLSIFCHHQWIGSLLTLESSAHTSIQSLQHLPTPLTTILQHHHTIITHLTWLNISLSSHTLTPYLHNNTYNTLGRAEDIFHDNSTHLYPPTNTLSKCNNNPLGYEGHPIRIFRHEVSYLSCLDWLKLAPTGVNTLFEARGVTLLFTRANPSQEIGTADFLVDHIHAFSLHLTVLIILKAISHTRTSRLISDKLDLGFHYPCDGPARGGTCQISPWDHLFLSPSWMYNLLDVLLFHYFWKMQSDI